MSVYASICMYFYQKYMHIHQAVYERISNSISGSIFVCISNSISCCIFRARTHGHGAVTVASHSPAPARGLCPFAARSLWQVCRAAAQAQACAESTEAKNQNSRQRLTKLLVRNFGIFQFSETTEKSQLSSSKRRKCRSLTLSPESQINMLV